MCSANTLSVHSFVERRGIRMSISRVCRCFRKEWNHYNDKELVRSYRATSREIFTMRVHDFQPAVWILKCCFVEPWWVLFVFAMRTRMANALGVHQDFYSLTCEFHWFLAHHGHSILRVHGIHSSQDAEPKDLGWLAGDSSLSVKRYRFVWLTSIPSRFPLPLAPITYTNLHSNQGRCILTSQIHNQLP